MHPMLGVGFGVYAEAAAGISDKAGERKRWQVSHNAFTQVSSETGVPAMILFIGTLFYTWRTISRARRLASSIPEMADLALMASCMSLVLLIYMVNCFFANIAQELFYYMICGFAMACGAIVEQRYAFLMHVHRTAATDSIVPVSGLASGREIREAQGRFRPAAKDVSGGSDQYGNVPWARNPRRTGSGN
jgi:hypothetical protein